MIIHQLVLAKIEHPLSIGEDLHLTECQQITDKNQKSEFVPPKKQVPVVCGAGQCYQWCKWWRFLAQVVAISGAGGGDFWRR